MAARPIARRDIVSGTAWALAAGLCWGGAFIAPLVLTGYHAVEITAGRFVGSGVFSALMLAIAWMRSETTGLRQPRLWLTAFGLAMVGNFIYFTAITAGIQMANAAIVTLIIGLLPIAIPVIAALQDGTFSARLLALPSALIFGGLLAVHGGAHPEGFGLSIDARYLGGLAMAGVGLVAWTAYALANKRVMDANATVSASVWSSMQGVTLLPVAVPILALTILTGATHNAARPSIETFIAVSIALGIVTSWVATWCWNRASQLLPPKLAGQLLVFETIASLTYVYLWTRAWPPLLVVAGTGALIAGVILGIRAVTREEATTV